MNTGRGAHNEVLQDIARAVLRPAELVAAYAGGRTPGAERTHRGVLSTTHGSYRVRGEHVDLDSWHGHTISVPLTELMALAATVGTCAACDRLTAALADDAQAHKDASRYIRKHGEGHYLDPDGQRTPEWRALYTRMTAVQTAAALWWCPDAGVPGEQLDLFEPPRTHPGA